MTKRKNFRMKARILAVAAGLALTVSFIPSFSAAADPVGSPNILQRFETAPAIDGVLSPGEWGAPDLLLPNYDLGTVPNGQAMQPLSGAVYFGYDDTHFYFAMQAQYDVHQNDNTDYTLYKGSALQIQITGTTGTGLLRNAFGFALTDDGHSRAYNSTSQNTWDYTAPGHEFYITRNAVTHTTTYEIALPLDWFAPNLSSLAYGSRMAFSFAIPMANGFNYEWMGGIVTVKDINQAAVMTLGDDKDLSQPSAPGSGYTLLTGDVDGSGKVDTTDARMVLQHIVGKTHLTDGALLAANVDGSADADGNGTVDTVDARMILQKIVNKIKAFPVGNTIDVGDPPPPAANSFSPTDPAAGSVITPDSPAISFGSASLLPDWSFYIANNPALPFDFSCALNGAGDEITALIPGGTALSHLIPTFTGSGLTVTAGGTAVTSGKTALDFSGDVVLTVKKGGQTQLFTVHIETLNTGLPSVSLTMDSYAAIADKVNYIPGTFTVSGGDPDTCPYATGDLQVNTCTAKGRGNSSWADPKKCYTIKLDQKATFFDMSNSKNWALVSNYEDKSLLRNWLADYLGVEAGQEWVPKSRPVDLWYNGVYWGTYNLVEKIEIEKDRVNIVKYDPSLQNTPDQFGYLMEFDAHVNEVSDAEKAQWRSIGPATYDPVSGDVFFPISIGGKWLTIHKPGYPDITPAIAQYIYDKVYAAIDALSSGDYARVSQVIDVESFTKWYIVEEFMNNTDSSMHSSVYMTLDVNGKLKLGPIWDFDRSSDNCNYWNPDNAPDALYSSGAGWFHLLYQMPEARTVLKNDWAKFKTSIAGLDAVIENGANVIYRSQIYNFDRWSILSPVSSATTLTNNAVTFEAQIKVLRSYCAKRVVDMDNFIKTI